MIQFTKLNEYFSNDTEDVKSFLQIVVKDWHNLRKEIIDAVANLNERQYHDATHKMISVIRLTEADGLNTALLQLHDCFKQQDTTDMQQRFANAISKFDELLHAMQEHIEEAQV